MAFQIGGTTVINNSRVASSMTGIPDLAHAETAWNNEDYSFNPGIGNWSAGEVNFYNEGIGPESDLNWNNLWIRMKSTLLGGGGSTYGSDVTIRIDGNIGSDTWTIIPSSHQWTIDSQVIIEMRKRDNGLFIQTYLTPSNYTTDAYGTRLTLQQTHLASDTVFETPHLSFDSIVVDWPSWGGGTNNTVNHEIFWR